MKINKKPSGKGKISPGFLGAVSLDKAQREGEGKENVSRVNNLPFSNERHGEDNAYFHEQDEEDRRRLAEVRAGIARIKEEAARARQEIEEEREEVRQRREEHLDSSEKRKSPSDDQDLPLVVGLPPAYEAGAKRKSHLPPGLGAEKRKRR